MQLAGVARILPRVEIERSLLPSRIGKMLNSRGKLEYLAVCITLRQVCCSVVLKKVKDGNLAKHSLFCKFFLPGLKVS